MSDMGKYLKLMLMVTLLSVMSDSAFTGETLKIGTGKWPPYTNVGDEQNPGFFTEVSRHVFKIMGVKTEEEEFPWKRAQKYVFLGEIDAIVGAYLTEKRSEHCFYPEEPVGTVKELLFIRSQDADRLFFNSHEDLKGKIIGVQGGAAHSEKLWDFLKKNGNYEEVPENEHNFKKLAAGRVEYIAAGEGVGTVLIKKLKLNGKILPFTDM